MKTVEVKQLIARKFAAPEHAVFYEVHDETGGASQSVDALVMNLWRSRGYELQGIEIKVSRSDWLRELKRPDKAERIFQYCDRWWLVTGSEDVIKPEELPSNWGWMFVKGGRLFVKATAPKLQPVQMSRPFLAAMCRRATEGVVPMFELETKVEAMVQERLANALRISETRSLTIESEYEDLKDVVKKFEEASGIRILYNWNKHEQLGKALRYLIQNGTAELMAHLERNKSLHEKSLAQTIEAIEELKPYSENLLGEQD